ncbi:MAG: phosphotransferase family protein [Haloarculaceae archaeon]
MSEVTADRLASYLSGRLGEGDVEVRNLTEHVEGWSRDTVSFTAAYETEDDAREERLVVRAQSDEQAEGGAGDQRAARGNDIETEFRTMEAAHEGGVRVPEPRWYEPDPSHLGGEFFLVEHLPGESPVVWDPRDRKDLYAAWDSEVRRLPNQFVDAAATIHDLGHEDVPELDDCAPGDVVERELDRWVGAYREAAFWTEPAIEEVIRWLRTRQPTVPETTLVHGDFRIGNMLVDDGELTGVLDWELARIGDPMYDLGYASTYYFSGKLVDPIERPNLVSSLVDREWFYEEYERRTGRTVDRERVRYWRVFAAFVMMTIAIAGADRYRRDETNDVRDAWFQYIVPGLVEDQLAIVRDDRL